MKISFFCNSWYSSEFVVIERLFINLFLKSWAGHCNGGSCKILSLIAILSHWASIFTVLRHILKNTTFAKIPNNRIIAIVNNVNFRLIFVDVLSPFFILLWWMVNSKCFIWALRPKPRPTFVIQRQKWAKTPLGSLRNFK